MTTNSKQDLRALHAQQTKNLILQAFADCLSERDSDDVSVHEIALQAGISTRTVYRHFPTRFDLLVGLTEWTRTNFHELLPLHELDRLPEVVAQAVQAFEKRPELSRVMVRTALGHDVLRGLKVEVHGQLRAVIDAELPDTPELDRRRLLGALSCLDSVQSWLALRDEFGMRGAEISDTLGWAISVLVRASRTSTQSSTVEEGRRA